MWKLKETASQPPRDPRNLHFPAALTASAGYLNALVELRDGKDVQPNVHLAVFLYDGGGVCAVYKAWLPGKRIDCLGLWKG